eukprot:6631756-Ditylum_brightwellii.AAC.2
MRVNAAILLELGACALQLALPNSTHCIFLCTSMQDRGLRAKLAFRDMAALPLHATTTPAVLDNCGCMGV